VNAEFDVDSFGQLAFSPISGVAFSKGARAPRGKRSIGLMCGICGVVGFESKDAGEIAVRRMLGSIVHRGPDEEGLLASTHVAVGTRRLSIIDLPGGSQPIWNEAGTLAVILNGEIYNFRRLRSELKSLNHEFRTQSDTEVIVHAYETWGADCVQHLDGMFAFAVILFPEGRGAPPLSIFLARDRLGIKPLYYTVQNDSFLFASEVRALLASGHVARRLSATAVPSYLLFGSVGEPSTFVEGVFSLLPGHAMTVPAANPTHHVEAKPYWDASPNPESLSNTLSSDSGRTPAQKVRTLLEHSVESQLVADVPVGIFLSSGIDSTALAAIAARFQKGIRTFTVAFPEPEFSEAEVARQTAKSLGTEHCEVSVSDQDMVSRLDEAIGSFDEPTMDGINTYFVSWAARNSGLKVALSGLGSDELFGGYTSFRATQQIRRLMGAARSVPRPIRAFLADRFRHSKSSRGSRDAVRKASAAWLDPVLLPHPYFFTRALFTPQTVSSVLRGNESSWASAPWLHWIELACHQAESKDAFTAVSWLELRSYLLSTLLRDTDATSMSHSLEVRVPFLDTSLVEYVLSLNQSVKYAAARPKKLLVDALGDLLPQKIVDQPKRTFTFPWEIWLHGKLGDRVVASLSDWSSGLEPHIDAHFAAAVWKDFLRGRTTWSRPWSLYVLNEWVKRNLQFQGIATADRASTAVTAA
jgi:asparagine synthase (glutamine-hydrolysing)